MPKIPPTVKKAVTKTSTKKPKLKKANNPTGKNITTIQYDYATVTKLAEQGLTNKQIGEYFGMIETTLYNHLKKDDELVMAIRQGRSKGVSKVAQALMNKIDEGDTNAIKFFLQTRGGWTQSMDITSNGESINTQPIIKIVAPVGFTEVTEVDEDGGVEL